MKYWTLPACMLLLMVTGCKKKNESSPTDKLCAHRWPCEKVTDNGAKVTTLCLISDEILFNKAGMGADYFPIKCNPSDNDVKHFKWTLSTDGKTLYISELGGVAGANINAQILQLTDNVLEFSYTGTTGHTYDQVYILREK